MRLVPLKQRLLDQVPAFASVAGAASLAAAMQLGRFDHSAYIFVSRINAQPNELDNAIEQRVPVEITVAYWVRDVSDATGEAAMERVEELREAVLAALLGWTPPDQVAPLEYRSGEVISFSFGTVLWADKYTLDTYVRITP